MILWEVIFWRQWNEKMVRYVMTLNLSVGRNMKWMITLNLCLVPLKKILEIKYTYGSLKEQMEKKILDRVTILFISKILGERGELFISKGRRS